jgi:hypothetical protein
MNLPPENPHDPLEAVLHRTLRAQPLRRAPRSLESRVFAELARRAALPWWRKSFAFWPAPVRAAFFVLSAIAAAALVAGVYVVSANASHQIASEVAGRLGWLGFVRQLGSIGVDTFLAVGRSIPTLWLFGGAALFAGAYATLIGAGAVAYRTWHQSPRPHAS